MPDHDPHELDLSDSFNGSTLDPATWVDHYLPQWTTPDRSQARYDLDASGLHLRIDADQPCWRDEDGGLRVSNIQTGTFSGPTGSDIGTHRHTADLVVRSAVPTRRLWTPASGRVEATLSASADPSCMVAVWLIGLEESSPEDSGEICIAELFGTEVGATGSRVRLGIKAINDPRLTTDVADVDVEFDTSEPHSYGATWSDAGVDFFIDDELVRHSDQSLGYPMQLMIDLFEFRNAENVDSVAYPKRGTVHSVRGSGARG